MLNNDIKVLAIGVAYTPRSIVRSGIGWIWDGIATGDSRVSYRE